MPETRKGGEHKVHETVQISHIRSQDLDNRLRKEELKGALYSDLDRLEKRTVWAVKFSVQGRVARLFAQLVTFPGKELGSVGFLQEKEAKALDYRREDGGCIETPPPGRVLTNEPTSNGSNGWAK